MSASIRRLSGEIENVKKLAMTLAAMALFGSAAQAETKQKMVGSWMVHTQEDAFDKGGTHVMFTGIPSFMFGIRCLQKFPSFGIILPDDKLTVGQRINVKLRVDHGDIVEVDGIAIEEHLIQAENNFKIWKDLPGGKEIAIRLENEAGVSQTQVFKISGAASALPTVTRECPIKD
jgi:hypothetical protein